MKKAKIFVLVITLLVTLTAACGNIMTLDGIEPPSSQTPSAPPTVNQIPAQHGSLPDYSGMSDQEIIHAYIDQTNGKENIRNLIVMDGACDWDVSARNNSLVHTFTMKPDMLSDNNEAGWLRYAEQFSQNYIPLFPDKFMTFIPILEYMGVSDPAVIVELVNTDGTVFFAISYPSGDVLVEAAKAPELTTQQPDSTPTSPPASSPPPPPPDTSEPPASSAPQHAIGISLDKSAYTMGDTIYVTISGMPATREEFSRLDGVWLAYVQASHDIRDTNYPMTQLAFGDTVRESKAAPGGSYEMRLYIGRGDNMKFVMAVPFTTTGEIQFDTGAELGPGD
ncbi:MAG: hypothetical protein LBC96_01990 [Lachnospiraceae bacterium]|jgi:hypothetical protein|nr:hypothetical protein [Lachnospiraceae bacterium]